MKRILLILVFIFTFFAYTDENVISAKAAESSYELGDTNSDNHVGVNDIVRLKRIMQGAAEATSNSYVAGNDSVSDVDLTILRQILVCDKDSTTVKTAFFIGNEGELAKMQTVPINGSAVPPIMPEKDGYYPGGWSADYRQIVSSTVLRPVYISNTANNIFMLDSATVSEGEEVSLKWHLYGTVDVLAFEMVLVYDADVLEVVSCGAINSNVVINAVEHTNTIEMNYAKTSNTKKQLELAQVTFKVKDGAQFDGTEIKMETVRSGVSVDDTGTQAEYTIIPGLIYME